MNSSGRGGNSRKNKHKFSKPYNKKPESFFTDGKFEKDKTSIYERPRWTAPELPVNSPITSPDCKWCGKPITDIASAICDKETGAPVHFECVLARISEMEELEENDSVCYIGGGRFGVVHYNNPPDTKDFTIKKIYEWEPKDANVNSEWRRPISEYFSIT